MPAERNPQVKSAAKGQNQKRILLSWLRPLLLISLGLHGLALLIPLPEKDIIVEQEEVPLPEPIPVTTLPSTLEPEPALPPVAFTPEPAPIIEAPFSPEPVVPPQVVVPTPEPEPELEPEPEPEPEPSSELPSAPLAPSDEPSATTAANPNAAGGGLQGNVAPLVVRTRDMKGTSIGDSRKKLKALEEAFNDLTKELVRDSISLSFPSDGFCFEDQSSGEAASNETIYAALVVEKDPATGDIYEIDGGVLQLTGYNEADIWIDRVLFPPEQIDPSEPELPPTPPFDFLQWVTDTHGQPLLDDGETIKLFQVVVQVEFVNNCQRSG